MGKVASGKHSKTRFVVLLVGGSILLSIWRGLMEFRIIGSPLRGTESS